MKLKPHSKIDSTAMLAAFFAKGGKVQTFSKKTKVKKEDNIVEIEVDHLPKGLHKFLAE